MWSNLILYSNSAGDTGMKNIAQYIEDYVDLVENLPNEIIRQVTQLHEQNHRYHKLQKKLEEVLNILIGKNDEPKENNSEKSTDINKQDNQDNQKDATILKKTKALFSLQKCLLDIQEIADDKLYIAQCILDQLDFKARQLDYDWRFINQNHSNNLNSSKSDVNNIHLSNDDHHSRNGNNGNNENNVNNDNTYANNSSGVGTNSSNSVNNTHHNNSSKRSSSRRNLGSNKNDHYNASNEVGSSSTSNHNNHSNSNNVGNSTGKRGVKRGVKAGNKEIKRNKNNNHGNSNKDLVSNSPSALYDDTPIDPDEPTYCSCEQVSFGEMICCDNSACTIEWFHFSCVSLTTKPKGKWYCPNCRGDRSNIPKK